MGKLKSEVVNKEAKIHEVELTLEVEHRKIEAYEDHIRHLNQQLKELQDQTCLVVQEKSSVFMKLKSNLQADENINTQLMKGKSRLRLRNCRVCNTYLYFRLSVSLNKHPWSSRFGKEDPDI